MSSKVYEIVNEQIIAKLEAGTIPQKGDHYCDHAPLKNGRLSMVYDGQVADDLTKDDLFKAILREYECTFDEDHIKAMNEAFRCGFLHGEDYGKGCSSNSVAIKWCSDDVLEVRPDLTGEQASQVLSVLVDKHDATIGINWDVIETTADDLFPKE